MIIELIEARHHLKRAKQKLEKYEKAAQEQGRQPQMYRSQQHIESAITHLEWLIDQERDK